MKHWLRGAWAVLRKDLRLELRSRYVLNALLVFVLSALLVVALATGADSVDTRIPEVYSMCARLTGAGYRVQVPSGEGLAPHSGREPCGGAREGSREASVAEQAGGL